VRNEQWCAGLRPNAGLIKHSQLGSVKLQSLLVCSTGRKCQPAAPAEEKQRGKTEEHASFRVQGVILRGCGCCF